MYQGYPVFGNDIGVHIRKDGMGTPVVTGVGNPRPPILLRTASSPYPGPNGATLGPALSAQDAVAKALPSTGSKALAQTPASAKLVFYPAGKDGEDVVYALTWQLRFTTAGPFGDWQANVDAATGEVLSKRNYVEIVPTPTGGQSQPLSPGVTATPPPTPTRSEPKIYPPDPSWKSPTVPPPPPVPTKSTSVQGASPNGAPLPKVLSTATPGGGPTGLASPTPAANVTRVRIPTAVNPAPTATSSQSRLATSGCSLALNEGFEGGFPPACWETRGYPTWGTTDWSDPAIPPAYAPHGGQRSLWCAGTGRNVSTDNYADNMDAWVIYGPFDLSGLTWAQLHFYYWSRLQGADSFSALASVDGDWFYPAMSQSGYTSGWEAGLLDLMNVPGLGNLTGRSSIWIAFRFWSDAGANDWGTFVDDVSLEIRRANLAPYTPPDWASPLIPASTRGTYVVNTLDANGGTYVDWAVYNNGAADSGPFDVGLYLDGNRVYSRHFDNMPPWTYWPDEDVVITTPSPGWHTLSLIADYGGTVQESDENDNQRAEGFFWHSPDLTYETPANWDYPIVPSSTAGTTRVGALYAARPYFVDLAVVNNGDLGAYNFYISLYRDGSEIDYWWVAGLEPGQHWQLQDAYEPGSPVLMGNHTLKLVTDSRSALKEANEGNNSWQHDFYWSYSLGQVFDPNPIATSGDTTLRDNNNQDSPALNAQLRTVTLQDLDSSGRLSGPYAKLNVPVSPNYTGYGCNDNQAYDPGLIYFYTRSDVRFEEVMAYYHIDAMAHYIMSLGLPNLFPTPLKVWVHCNGTGHYSTGVLTFAHDLNVDSAEDGEIIGHELGHSIQMAQIGDWDSNNDEGGALGEGFGYYWPTSYFYDKNTATPVNPSPVTLKTCLGDWGYSGALPDCSWPVFNYSKHYPESWVSDNHFNGQIWSTALWDIRNALGRAEADFVILQSHYNMDVNTRLGEGADATVAADQTWYSGGHKSAIVTAFKNRGIFDQLEIDNSATTASPITPNGPSQRHTFHSFNDVDWVRLNASAWYQYSIRTFDLQANANTKLEVYWNDGATKMMENDNCPGAGLSSCVTLTAPINAPFFIRVVPYNANATGRNSGYSLSVTVLGRITPSKLNLPLMMK